MGAGRRGWGGRGRRDRPYADGGLRRGRGGGSRRRFRRRRGGWGWRGRGGRSGGRRGRGLRRRLRRWFGSGFGRRLRRGFRRGLGGRGRRRVGLLGGRRGCGCPAGLGGAPVLHLDDSGGLIVSALGIRHFEGEGQGGVFGDVRRLDADRRRGGAFVTAPLVCEGLAEFGVGAGGGSRDGAKQPGVGVPNGASGQGNGLAFGDLPAAGDVGAGAAVDANVGHENAVVVGIGAGGRVGNYGAGVAAGAGFHGYGLGGVPVGGGEGEGFGGDGDSIVIRGDGYSDRVLGQGGEFKLVSFGIAVLEGEGVPVEMKTPRVK